MKRARPLCWAGFLGGLALSGCAGYAPLALPQAPDGAAAPSFTAPAVSRTAPARPLEVPELAVSTSAASGLTQTDAMALAVLNDPDLRAARLKAGVAQAQIFAAGLLPDPRFGAGVSRGPEFTGYSLSLSEDLEALVLRPAAKASARANGKKVDLSVLWQEWRTAEKAGELFVRAREDARLEETLSESRRLLAGNYERDQSNFRQSSAALEKVSADLAVLADADARLRSIRLDADAARHRLDYLLGLSPDAQPRLLDGDESLNLSAAEFRADLAELPRRRVDLLALQAGYDSGQERLRQAVLAQFPVPAVGADWGRDAVDGIHSAGLSLDFPLPVLNGGRGRIAVLRAGRAALRQAYQARLDQSQNQADQVHSATLIMAKELDALRAQTSAMKSIASSAEQRFRAEEMSAGAYVGLEAGLLKDEEESIRLQASLDSARLQLDLLLGLPLRAQRL